MKELNNSRHRLSIYIASLFAILLISNSCSEPMGNMNDNGDDSGGSGGPGTNEVWIQGMQFKPSTITVTAGTTITWTNKDAVIHTVTSDPGVFDSGSINNNGTFSYTFSTAGTYPYHCTPHPSMTATVTVN
jgi:plastocyanin